MKFLLAGDGINSDVLEKRQKLNQSKHGPFDAVYVGNFFKNEKDSTTLSTGVGKRISIKYSLKR